MKRWLRWIALACAAATLSACVVVPARPYRYGPGPGYYHHHYYGGGYYYHR